MYNYIIMHGVRKHDIYFLNFLYKMSTNVNVMASLKNTLSAIFQPCHEFLEPHCSIQL